MKEIREDWYDLIEADTGIRNKTGHTAGDTRIYEESPPKRVTIDSTTPAYITYKWLAPGGIVQDKYVQKAQYPDEINECNVWAQTSNLRDEIAERIDFITKDKNWETTNYRVMTTDRESFEDIQEIHPGTAQLIIKRKYIRFRFRLIFRK